jgi:hypothetical protein
MENIVLMDNPERAFERGDGTRQGGKQKTPVAGVVLVEVKIKLIID